MTPGIPESIGIQRATVGWLSAEERAEIEEFKGLAATPGGGVPIVERLLAHAEAADGSQACRRMP